MVVVDGVGICLGAGGRARGPDTDVRGGGFVSCTCCNLDAASATGRAGAEYVREVGRRAVEPAEQHDAAGQG